MIEIAYLDIMIQYACNLSCQGCITMTDHNRKGWVNAAEGKTWLDSWSKSIRPNTVCLFGGEPLLNRDLRKWIMIVRDAWPDAVIKVITNGFYLNKVPVLDWLSGPSELQLSLHFRNDARRDLIISNLKDAMKNSKIHFVPTVSQGPHEKYRFTSGIIDVIIAEFGEFRKPYSGLGASMKPANGNPKISHSKCGSPNNPILYKNKLYKCGPIANLADTLSLHDQLLDDASWKKYLEYDGYAVTDDLVEFAAGINKPECICSMCPDDDRELIDHYALGAVVEKRHC